MISAQEMLLRCVEDGAGQENKPAVTHLHIMKNCYVVVSVYRGGNRDVDLCPWR